MIKSCIVTFSTIPLTFRNFDSKQHIERQLLCHALLKRLLVTTAHATHRPAKIPAE
jgi:hypothetical protein